MEINEEKSYKRKIFRNSLYSLIIPILPLAINFFLMPFMIRRLGKEAFGLWALCLSITGYAGLLDLGFMQTVVKRVAEYLATGNRERLRDFSCKIMTIYLLIGITAGLMTAMLAGLGITRLLHISETLRKDTTLVFMVLALHIALSFPFRFWEGYVQASQGFAFYALTSLVSTAIQSILTVIALVTGHGVFALAIIALASSSISWAMYFSYYLAKKEQHGIRLSLVRLSRSDVSSLLSLSFKFFLLQACAMIILQTDRLLIAVFLPISAITTFEIGLRIHNMIRNIVTSVQMVILPAASELSALEKRQQLKRLVTRGTKYILVLFLLLATPTALLSKEIINLWIGKEQGLTDQAYPILLVLLSGQMLNALNFVTGQVFMGMMRISFYLRMRLLSAILNVALSIFFLKLFGLIGVAMGTAVQFAITDVILLAHFLKELGIDKKGFILRSVLPPLSSSLGGGVALLAVKLLLERNLSGLPFLVACGLAFLAVYSFLIIGLVVRKEERKEIISWVTS